MTTHKLSSTDAFVVFDLEGAAATGIVRAAPKILPAGAADLARSLTYAFATYGIERGGASAGINTAPETRDAAIAAFVDEMRPMVVDGRLSLDPGKGVEAAAIAELTELAGPGTSDVRAALAGRLAALGPVVATDHVLGGLDGKRIVIEGFGETGPTIVNMLVERGASVVAISTSAGALVDDTGLDPAALGDLWADHGEAMVGDDAQPAWKVFATEADAMLAGSKMGAINHQSAERLNVKAVVPHAPIPYTARALAVMQHAGIIAVADFISTGAAVLGSHRPGADDPEAIASAAGESIVGVLDETLGHPEGAFLGASLRAESFLKAWHGSVPFGRPLAS